jgi:hypothetical protein
VRSLPDDGPGRRKAREGLGLPAVERREDGASLGHGYATEAATAWLDHGFGPLGLPRVISITDPPNRRSRAAERRGT